MGTNFLIYEHPLVLAIGLAILGFVLASILAKLTDMALMRMERALSQLMPKRSEPIDTSIAQPILRKLVYYTTLILFLLLSLQTLGISVFEDWLSMSLTFIPQVVLAAIIVLFGYFLGVITRVLVAGVIDEKSDQLLPKLAQLSVMAAAILTGLHQMAIDISFITDVIAILLAAFVGGLSLAFALGSKQLVANLLARRSLEQYSLGRHIRIDGIEGQIIEILSTAVVVESSEGLITIPTARFAETEVLVLQSETDEPA